MQCSLNKDRQRPKWQPQKSLTLYPDCHDVQDNLVDAVSVFTQVQMEDASTLLRISKSECPDLSIRPPKHIWSKSWCSMDDPVVLLEKNLYGHPLAGLLWERQLEKVINCKCLLVDRARELFLSVYVDDVKLADKTENIKPTWKIMMKNVDVVGCTQRGMYNERWECDKVQRYVRSQDFC